MNAFATNTPSATLVGRERELHLLRECLDEFAAGRGGLILIGGEAGIGKTALAETMCREAERQGALVLVGRCYDLTETPPYGPWVELFGRYRATGGLLPLPDAFAQGGAVGEVTNQATLFQQALIFFAALTAQQPALLLLDDLHWGDPASLDLLRFLARHTATMPCLVAVTCRNEEVGRDHPLYTLLPILVRESRAQRLDLRPLPRDAMAAWVTNRYRLGAGDAERVVSHLAERAEGNPLFVGELLRSLEEAGVLYRHDERWLLGDLNGQSVPPLLRAVIDTRVTRLGVESQRLLAIAAVIGAAVPYDRWTAIAGVAEETVLAVVAAAEAAHVMAEERDGMGAAFTHALIRAALYEGMRPSERRRWHRIAGETFAALPDADPDTVADHLRRAGDARAVDWLIAAGDRAARVYAWTSAADRFETALALLDAEERPRERGWLLFRLAALRRWGDPQQGIVALEEAERLATLTGDQGLAAHAVFQRGMSRCIAGDLRRGVPEMEAGAAARRAFSAAERARLDTLLQPLTILDSTDGQGPLSQWLATVGRYADARSVGERALDAVPDGGANGGIFLGLGQAYAGLGMPEAAREAFERTRQIVRAAGNDFQLGMNAANEVNWTLPFIADRPSEVLRLWNEMAEAFGRATGVGSVTAYQFRYPRIGHAICTGAWGEARRLAMLEAESPRGIQPTTKQLFGPLLYAQGDRDWLRSLVDETLPQGPETSPGGVRHPGGLTFLRLAAMLALDAGDLDEAGRWLAAHDRWVAWSDSPMGAADGALAWAVYNRASGDKDTAVRKADEAMALAVSPRQPLVLLAAHRLRGELALDADEHDAAARHLTEALDLADACAAPYERALTLIPLAALHVARGEHTIARALLDEARTICTPLDAKPAIARIDALLGILPGDRSAAPTYPAGLTARETEVLRLVAAGKTNREIGDLLFLSPNTVRIHVTHILDKTNAENRAAAAAFAQRYGLT